MSPVRSCIAALVASALLATPALAGKLPAPNFKGKTAQGLPVQWTLKGSTIWYFEATGRDTCGKKWRTSDLKIHVRADGRFHAYVHIQSQAHFHVDGRVSGNRASGRFESDQNGCQIGPEKFSAHRIH